MGRLSRMSRRSLMKWGLLSAGVSVLPRGRFSSAFAQVGGRAEAELYEGLGVPGGGQVDPRLTVSSHSSDPDIVEVANRLSPFNPESWHVEWKRVAEKNEKLAEGFEKEGLKVTANEYYLRAALFYQRAVTYQPESDPRMLPTFNKLVEVYQRAWKLVPPSFEIVEIPYEGKTLNAYFSKPRGTSNQRFPTVYAYGGADSVTVSGGGAAYTARGMAYLAVDGPGQG
ncbi:MAG: alpha/beta hydrolase, partial [Acidobacteria bacterium]|nr:alpha/beta hydrolase [Acidobacteriota bacterium]